MPPDEKPQVEEASGHGGTPDSVLTGWSAELAERVVDAVAWVRSRATVRLATALGFLVYGLVAVVGVLAAVVLLLIGLVRIWDAYVPVDPLGRRVWLFYVVFGGMLFLLGAWLWSRAREQKR
ncbi:MAG TPA: hypothetical protein VED59_04475 [Acidimicrobiales bacterium]|nr:hypothetical protein [Acidimicrobiales bacterium]